MNSGSIVIGLIGSRFAASFHLENYRRVPGFDLRVKGVASRSRERAADFAKKHGLENVYDSAEELLADPEIDLVDLCVPNYLHHPLTLEAAAAGKNIICEKPLTGYFGQGGETLVGKETPRRRMFEDALRSADEMVDAVARYGVTFCYAENWIYAPSVQKAREVMAQSENTILRIVAEESHSGTHSEYAKEWRHCGGGSLSTKAAIQLPAPCT